MAERILVVDDEENVARTLSALLDREGYQIRTASSLADALTRLDADRFDAVLLDLMLAGEDGLQVLARLRETSPDAVAIVLTGYGTLPSATRAIQLGVSDYLTKPCPIDELKAALDRGLEKRRALLGARREIEEERGRLLAAERVARAEAERLANRNARLQEVTAALSRAVSVSDVGRAIAEHAVAATGAAAGALGAILEDGVSMALVGAAGYSDEAVRRFARFSVADPLPMADVARERSPRWIRDQSTFVAHYPHLRAPSDRGRIAVVPLEVGDQVLGAISLSFPEDRDFTSDERELILAVAFEGARALLRARLSDNARRARSEAEDAQRRLRELFLAAPAMIVVTRGPDHVVEIVNARFLAALGRGDPEAVLGRPAREAFPELVPLGYVALADRVYRSGEPLVDPEMPARRDADGDGQVEARWTSVVIQPYRDDAGRVAGLLFHGVDVTEQVQARHRVEEATRQVSAERAFLETVIRQMPAGIAIVDAASDRVLLANAPIFELARVSAPTVGEVLDHATLEGYGPDRRRLAPEDWPLVRATRRGETVVGEEVRFRRGDGSFATLQVSAAPVRDADGRIVAGVVSFVDVSARVQVEQELRTTNETLGAIVAGVPLAVMGLDARGHVTLWNPGAERIFGWTAAEVLGRPLPTIPPGRADEFRGHLRKVFGGTSFDGVETRRVRKDGSAIDVAIYTAPIRDGAGNVVANISVVADISERKRVERDQRRLAELSRDLAAAQLDRSRVLGVLCRTAAAAIGEHAAIHLVADDGVTLLPTALHDPDEARRELRARVLGDQPLRVGESWTGGVVAREEPLFLPSPDLGDLRARTAPAHRACMEKLFGRGIIIVPMRAHGRVLGALTVGRGGPGPRYTPGDLALLQEMADRAALVVEDVRLYEDAQRAADRVARLQAVTASLVERLTPESVAQVVVEQAIGALGAEYGAVGLLVDEGAAFEVLRTGGYPADPRVEEELRRWERFPVARGGTWGEVARTGEPIFVSSAEERLARSPQLARTQEALRLSASATLPLTVEGRVVGVLWLSFPGPRALAPDDRDFLLALARQCSQALERARLDAAERQAREGAERSLRHLARLQRITAALATAATQEEVARAVVAEAIGALGAKAASVIASSADGSALETVLRVGYVDHPPETGAAPERWDRFPIDLPTPAGDAVRRGDLVILASSAERAARYPHLAGVSARIGEGASVTVPLLINSHPIGALHLAFAGPQAFDAEDQALLLTIGRLCAQAFERARLLTAEQAARAEAEAARQRATVLAETTRLLVEASLDERELLDTICRRVAEVVGDGCTIALRAEDGSGFATAALFHPDRERRALAWEMARAPTSGTTGLAARITQSGEPIVIPEIRPEHLAELVRPDRRAYGERYGFHSLAVFPLRSRRETIGALSVWRDGPGKSYTGDDLGLLQDLAGRAAIAIENARLYTQAREAVRVRDEFLSIAAHELKTPITSLRGTAQLLLRTLEKSGTVDAQRLRGRLAAINQQSGKIGRLVNQLLDVSRLDAGKLTLDRAPTDLPGLVRGVAEAAEALSDRHAIAVRAEGAAIATVDPIRLEQVLTNLVDNAIKYSPDGGPIEIALTRPSPGEVAISVTDRGLGIPPEHRSRIFDRFFQAHAGNHYSGMGLGLYVSRQIVELHGGTLEADFPAEGGTRFVVRLPVGTAPSTEARQSEVARD